MNWLALLMTGSWELASAADEDNNRDEKDGFQTQRPTKVAHSSNATGVSCGRCGFQTESSDKFCTRCGAATSETFAYCDQCGSRIAESDKFCTFCGAAARRGDSRCSPSIDDHQNPDYESIYIRE